jgi:uncharacterized protein (DUF1330 family)
MSGYIITNYTIHNPEVYEKYPPAVVPTIFQYGGKVLVADYEANSLEGSPQNVIVVLEFESVEAAQRWYNSPEYREIIHLRTSSTEGWALIAKKFVMPES